MSLVESSQRVVVGRDFPIKMPMTLVRVNRAVCAHFKIGYDEIISDSHEMRVTWPRMVAMYIARAYTKFSLMQIGDRLNRDHTTVVSAVAKVKKLVEQRDDVIGDIEMIRRMLDL